MNQSTNQTFGLQQNNNRQLQRPQNTGNLQRALNTGRQALGPQNTPNLFNDTYNDLVRGSNPLTRTQGVEISPQIYKLPHPKHKINYIKITEYNDDLI
ncbi:hypothetical protein C2G38_2161356 [Gigaspora rosea]|uniref:Uncharacterized protein n=1 Tax=Gigaspora rosea TaxID=44941 RepID=A0A397W1K4_9GLOM|nr:hypothetical protein C2G38_2161356 [Gigaspora rosea]